MDLTMRSLMQITHANVVSKLAWQMPSLKCLGSLRELTSSGFNSWTVEVNPGCFETPPANPLCEQAKRP